MIGCVAMANNKKAQRNKDRTSAKQAKKWRNASHQVSSHSKAGPVEVAHCGPLTTSNQRHLAPQRVHDWREPNRVANVRQDRNSGSWPSR